MKRALKSTAGPTDKVGMQDHTLSSMLMGYTEAMLWAGTYDDMGNVQDARDRDIGRIATRQATRDVRAFLRDVETPDDIRAEWHRYLDEVGAEYAGHDFALSRNAHGAGFFSRGSGFPALQAFAKRYGEVNWRIARTGKVTV